MAAKSYVAIDRYTTDGTSFPFTGISIGNASGLANPKILVGMVMGYSGALIGSAGVTITWSGLGSPILMEPVNAPQLEPGSDGGPLGWFMCDHPGGAITTATITVAAASTMQGVAIATYLLSGADRWDVLGRTYYSAAVTPGSGTVPNASGDYLFAAHGHGRTTDRYATFGSAIAGSAGPTTITGGRDSFTAGVTRDAGIQYDSNSNSGGRTRLAMIALRPIGDGSNPGGTPPAGDPYWNNVVLLVRPRGHYAGENPATYLVDESSFAHGAPTRTGNTTYRSTELIDTGASLWFDGTNDWLSWPDSNDWALGGHTDPWTVEVRWTPGAIGGVVQHIIGQAGASLAWQLVMNAGVWEFRGHNGTTQWTLNSGISAVLNTPTEIMVDHDATGTVRIYVDGVFAAKTTPSDSTVRNVALALFLGTNSNSGDDATGHLSSCRITKGVARVQSDLGYTLAGSLRGGMPPFPNYIAADAVTSITPIFGTAAGGDAFTLVGSGFISATDVTFDGVSATSIVVVDDSTITGVTPAGLAGFVDVVVDRPTTDLTLVGGFEYISVSPPTVTLLVPDEGTVNGGTNVTLTGTDLIGTTGLNLNGIPVSSLVVVNATTITFTTTASAVDGLVDLDLFHPYGNFHLDDAFLYVNEARVTQVPALLIHLPIQGARITQIPILMVHLPIQATRITQVPIMSIWLPREIPLPTPVVPEVPVKETWEWLTVVTASDQNKEQRSALRGDPYVSQSFKAYVLDEAERRNVYNLMMKFIGMKFNYPDYTYSARLSAAAEIGDTKLFFNPAHTNLRNGDVVAIFDKVEYTTTLLTLATVDVDGATLANALTIDIPEYCTICPAPLYYVKTPKMDMDSTSGEFDLNLEGAQVRPILRPNQANAPTLVDTMFVLDKRPLADGPDDTFDQDVVWLDNGIASPEPYTNWRNAYISGPRTFLLHRPTDLDYWRSFAHYCKGRQNPILVPSFRDDLPLYTQPALSATIIETTNVQFFEYWRSKAWQYVRIQSSAGVIYRRILEVLADYDGEGNPYKLRIKLSASIGAGAGSNINMMVSFLNKCRLASDAIVLEHTEVDTFLSLSIAMVEE